MASIAVLRSPTLVTTTTSWSGQRSFTRCTSSLPSMPGITRSVTTTSKRSASSCASASAPPSRARRRRSPPRAAGPRGRPGSRAGRRLRVSGPRSPLPPVPVSRPLLARQARPTGWRISSASGGLGWTPASSPISECGVASTSSSRTSLPGRDAARRAEVDHAVVGVAALELGRLAPARRSALRLGPSTSTSHGLSDAARDGRRA